MLQPTSPRNRLIPYWLLGYTRNPMSKAGSTAAGIIVSVLIVASVGVLGYYQFVIAPNIPTLTSTSVTTNRNITPIRINITDGHATNTTDAYAPNPMRLVIGKN